MSTFAIKRELASSTEALGGSPSWDQLGFILGGVAALLLGLTLCTYIYTWRERRSPTFQENNEAIQVSWYFKVSSNLTLY